MVKQNVILIGSGGHAKVVIDIIELENKYKIYGILTNDNVKNFCGYKVLGNDEKLLELIKKGIKNVAIGIGGFRDNILREKIYNKVFSLNFNIINAIHPSAIIARTAKLGNGVVIFAGVIINPDVKIFNNIIIATGSVIDHETTIENHCLISAGVTVGANVLIKEGSLCALGAKIISQKIIGKRVLIAAGSVVTKNISDNEVVFGIPAKVKGN
jgi:sugar O-acyltransferase (sialic acid O-acetyltransferase NeuD family)